MVRTQTRGKFSEARTVNGTVLPRRLGVPTLGMGFPDRISGTMLRTLARLSFSTPVASAMRALFEKDLGIDALRALGESELGSWPQSSEPLSAKPRPFRTGELSRESSPSGFTAGGLTKQFELGQATPREVVVEIFEALARDAARGGVSPMLHTCRERALSEAEEALSRFRHGRPRGPLDGVPIVIKEELAVEGLPRAAGGLLDTAPSKADSTVVARLREAGALVVGTTVMTEYGMNPLGVNPQRKMPRNPHNGRCVAGGSSTGTAVAIATGLVPCGIGTDGGGSIRIPASLTGVFGLKPTWGRVPRAGMAGDGTVAHIGPLASSVLDLARVLDAIAGPSDADPVSMVHGNVLVGSFQEAVGADVRGLSIGIVRSEMALATPEVAAACERAARELEKQGATVVTVNIAMLEHASAIGCLTIGAEHLAAELHNLTEAPTKYAPDLQILHNVLASMTTLDLGRSARARTRLRASVRDVLTEVDVLLMPTTRSTAPEVTDGEFLSGFVDAKAIDSVCRFNFLGNVTGLPAISIPVGKGEHGLPIGVQLLADAWDEGALLACARALERAGLARAELAKQTDS